MDIKELIRREIAVILHGQSLTFRVIKYTLLVILFFLVNKFFGTSPTFYLFFVLVLSSLLVHFIFRNFTNGWRKSWGGFTPYKTPLEK